MPISSKRTLRILPHLRAPERGGDVQIYGSGTGKAKLEYVQGQLLSKGYAIDLDAIEAAVRRMNQTQPPTDPGNPE